MVFRIVARSFALVMLAHGAMADVGSARWPGLMQVSYSRPTVEVALPRLPAPDLSADAVFGPPAGGITEDWLMSLPKPEGDAEWECMTQALYFEARGESLEGQIAVAEVILNRVDSSLYPRTVCGVVKQRGGGGCQFSYVCDGRADRMREAEAADLAGRIARAMLDGAPRTLTDGAMYFHTRAVRPGWSKRFDRTAAIGAHLFYRRDPRG